MEPTKPESLAAESQNQPQDPLAGGVPPSPEILQPLNTAAPATPGTTGTSSLASDSGGIIPPSEGLPPQLPNTTQVSSSGGSKKMMLMIIVILILAILGVGGYYFYMQYSSAGTTNTTSNTETQTTQDLSNLETEVESIEVTDPAGDLVEIDSDINLLEATPASSAAKTTR